MSNAYHFCNRCGQPQHSHSRPCRQATLIPHHELFTGPLCRCPVEGCAFQLDSTGRSAENARSTFFSHLEWHEQQGLRPGEAGPRPDPVQRAEQSVPQPRERGEPFIMPPKMRAALLEASPEEIDWEAWRGELLEALEKLPAAPRQLVAYAITACVRSLEGVQW